MNQNLLLKKIVRKKAFKNFIQRINSSLEVTICITDADGNVLLGEFQESQPLFPIMLNSEVIGSLISDKKIPILADIISLWVNFESDKKALGEELLEKYREFSIFYSLTEQLANILDPQEAAQLIIKEYRRVIKNDDITIIDFENNDKEILATTLDKGICSDLLKACQGVISSVLQKRQPEIINSFSSDLRYKLDSDNVSSLICAPLAIKEKNIGVVIVSSKKQKDYIAGDLKLLSTIAYQAAAVIENSKLINRLKETIADLQNKKEELTNSIKMRMEFGHIFITIVLMVSLYTFMLFLLSKFNVGDKQLYFISRIVEIAFVLTNVWLVLRSRQPLANFGLTIVNAKKAIIESVLISVIFMFLLAMIKSFLIQNVSSFQKSSIISWNYVGWDYYTYIFVAPLQEFICRGVMQGSIQRFLIGRYSSLWAIVLTSSLFGVFHIHESIELGILAILGGFLWGWMFVRHKTLIGTSLCHFLIGNWLGVLGFWDIITHT